MGVNGGMQPGQQRSVSLQTEGVTLDGFDQGRPVDPFINDSGTPIDLDHLVYFWHSNACLVNGGRDHFFLLDQAGMKARAKQFEDMSILPSEDF